MPQTMQQKRKGSLERLKKSLTMSEREFYNTEREGLKTLYSNKITSLTRMIEHTEAAIQRNK